MDGALSVGLLKREKKSIVQEEGRKVYVHKQPWVETLTRTTPLYFCKNLFAPKFDFLAKELHTFLNHCLFLGKCYTDAVPAVGAKSRSRGDRY